MADEEFRKERLNQVIDLARIYRGWTKGELANALGRDASNMMPESGNPKLDLVFGLAEVLDWPVGDVAESLCRQDEPRPGPGETFDSVNDESLAAHASGHYKGMLACAAKMLQLARNPKERAQAALRMAGAFDGLGRYSKSLEWMQAALTEPNLPVSSRALLQANLGNAHYSVWHLVEARAIAAELLEPERAADFEGRTGAVALGLAHYVHGHSSRRMIPLDASRSRFFAASAKAHLEAAIRAYGRLLEETGEEKHGGVANTCIGGIIEVEVELGSLSPNEGAERILAGLDSVIDVTSHPRGDWASAVSLKKQYYFIDINNSLGLMFYKLNSKGSRAVFLHNVAV